MRTSGASWGTWTGPSSPPMSGGWSWSRPDNIVYEIGVTVSAYGAGTTAELTGTLEFTEVALESSSTYRELQKEFNIAPGIVALADWCTAHTAACQGSIKEMLAQLNQAPQQASRAQVKLFCKGVRPREPVTASAFIWVPRIKANASAALDFQCTIKELMQNE